MQLRVDDIYLTADKTNAKNCESNRIRRILTLNQVYTTQSNVSHGGSCYTKKYYLSPQWYLFTSIILTKKKGKIFSSTCHSHLLITVAAYWVAGVLKKVKVPNKLLLSKMNPNSNHHIIHTSYICVQHAIDLAPFAVVLNESWRPKFLL